MSFNKLQVNFEGVPYVGPPDDFFAKAPAYFGPILSQLRTQEQYSNPFPVVSGAAYERTHVPQKAVELLNKYPQHFTQIKFPSKWEDLYTYFDLHDLHRYGPYFLWAVLRCMMEMITAKLQAIHELVAAWTDVPSNIDNLLYVHERDVLCSLSATDAQSFDLAWMSVSDLVILKYLLKSAQAIAKQSALTCESQQHHFAKEQILPKSHETLTAQEIADAQETGSQNQPQTYQKQNSQLVQTKTHREQSQVKTQPDGQSQKDTSTTHRKAYNQQKFSETQKSSCTNQDEMRQENHKSQRNHQSQPRGHGHQWRLRQEPSAYNSQVQDTSRTYRISNRRDQDDSSHSSEIKHKSYTSDVGRHQEQFSRHNFQQQARTSKDKAQLRQEDHSHYTYNSREISQTNGIPSQVEQPYSQQDKHAQKMIHNNQSDTRQMEKTFQQQSSDYKSQADGRQRQYKSHSQSTNYNSKIRSSQEQYYTQQESSNPKVQPAQSKTESKRNWVVGDKFPLSSQDVRTSSGFGGSKKIARPDQSNMRNASQGYKFPRRQASSDHSSPQQYTPQTLSSGFHNFCRQDHFDHAVPQMQGQMQQPAEFSTSAPVPVFSYAYRTASGYGAYQLPQAHTELMEPLSVLNGNSTTQSVIFPMTNHPLFIPLYSANLSSAGLQNPGVDTQFSGNLHPVQRTTSLPAPFNSCSDSTTSNSNRVSENPAKKGKAAMNWRNKNNSASSSTTPEVLTTTPDTPVQSQSIQKASKSCEPASALSKQQSQSRNSGGKVSLKEEAAEATTQNPGSVPRIKKDTRKEQTLANNRVAVPNMRGHHKKDSAGNNTSIAQVDKTDHGLKEPKKKKSYSNKKGPKSTINDKNEDIKEKKSFQEQNRAGLGLIFEDSAWPRLGINSSTLGKHSSTPVLKDGINAPNQPSFQSVAQQSNTSTSIASPAFVSLEDMKPGTVSRRVSIIGNASGSKDFPQLLTWNGKTPEEIDALARKKYFDENGKPRQ